MSSAIDSLQVNILGNNNQKHISVESPDTLTGKKKKLYFLLIVLTQWVHQQINQQVKSQLV